jgi:hypothetical protein
LARILRERAMALLAALRLDRVIDFAFALALAFWCL